MVTTSDEDYLTAMMGSPLQNCTDDPSDLPDEITDDAPLTYYYTPDSASIHATVRWAFLLHAYAFACLFFFLAFYAFFSILNLR